MHFFTWYKRPIAILWLILSEWVIVPHWLGNGLVVCLYGLGQYSPHELDFGVELGLGVIFSWYQSQIDSCLGSRPTLQLGLGVKGGLKSLIGWEMG